MSIPHRSLRARFVSRIALAAIALVALASSRPEPATARMRVKTHIKPHSFDEITGEVTPDGSVIPYGTTTADLEVFWCSDSESAYLTGGATFTFNGQDVSNSFFLSGNGNQERFEISHCA